MNPVGKIRIKSFGTLLPPNIFSPPKKEPEISPQLFPSPHFQIECDFPDITSESTESYQISNDNLNVFPESSETCSIPCAQQISLSPASFKIEAGDADPPAIDCVDLTEDQDTFETPVRLKSTKEKPLKGTQTNKITNSKAKTNTKSQIKLKPGEDASQMKLLSFFTPSVSVKKAPKKLGKPPEEKDATNSTVENAPPRKLRKLTLRRNILKDVPPSSSKKSKTETEEEKEEQKSKPSTTTRSLRSKTTKRKSKSKAKDELENIPEPTVIPGVIDLCLDCDSDEDLKVPIKPQVILPKRPATVNSEKSNCPSYKIIEGTTFAVDGFKYGRIEGVTAYFLSHYHADHYIGLTRKFSMPLYVSQITASLIREFIPIDEKFINILPLNVPTTIENVQVTAIDANHCPGAVMFLFQLPCGKRILHTGDFRASIAMESDPHLIQRNINLLYLDTTYISHNYSFQTQEQSIADALNLVRGFKERNEGKRILLAVGTYLVGKEKFWLPIAKEFNFKVWTDSNRRKIMQAINDQEILERLVTKPKEAEMHIIPMMKVGYRGIEAYWEDYSDAYDMIFAIRPSGWEKNAKPQYRGKINIIGIEYSEHSSYSELRRFLSFLRPEEVISTVPYGKDLTQCSNVPLSWYRPECFSPIKKQSSMLDYFACSKPGNKKS